MVEAEEEGGETTGGKVTEMGRKAIVPYGLYRAQGFFTPHFAKSTGVDEVDLEVFWEAVRNMWELDRSSSRGLIALRGLYVFSHDSAFGNAAAHDLFERVGAELTDEVKTNGGVPRESGHYRVEVQEAGLPEEVTLHRPVG